MHRGFGLVSVVIAVGLASLACSACDGRSTSGQSLDISPTTVTGVTTSLPPTTTPGDCPTLQDRVIAAPAGYTFASDLGDPNDPNVPGGSSGEISASELNTILGVPSSATTLHFACGYGQFYHYDASPPNSITHALEVELYEFGGSSDATDFVGKASDRIVRRDYQGKKAATAVSGMPAVVVNDLGKSPDGTYDHALFAAHLNRTMVLFYSDTTPGPSSFLMKLAGLQYAAL